MKLLSFVLVFLLCVGAGNCAFAQTLAIDPPSKSVTGTVSEGEYEAFSIYYTNKTGYPLNLKWKTLVNTLGATWDYSLCDFGRCYAGIPDSSTMSMMEPDTTGYLKLNLSPLPEAGSGIVKIFVYNENTPDVGDTMTFIVNVTQTSVDDEQKLSSSVSAYPSIVSNSIKFTTVSEDVFMRSISVYSADGKNVLGLSGININDYCLDISTLSTGMYIARVETNDGNVTIHKFEKVH